MKRSAALFSLSFSLHFNSSFSYLWCVCVCVCRCRSPWLFRCVVFCINNNIFSFHDAIQFTCAYVLVLMTISHPENGYILREMRILSDHKIKYIYIHLLFVRISSTSNSVAYEWVDERKQKNFWQKSDESINCVNLCVLVNVRQRSNAHKWFLNKMILYQTTEQTNILMLRRAPAICMWR